MRFILPITTSGGAGHVIIEALGAVRHDYEPVSALRRESVAGGGL
jgi:hypothetical protein